MTPRDIEKLLGPTLRRVKLMIGRCVLMAINDAPKLQTVQVTGLEGETLDQREHFQHYGFTSHPHPGAEGVILALAGNRNHTIIINIDDRRYRIAALEEGEVALYDDQGQKVHIKRNGIHVEALNILLKSDGVIRIDGDGVEVHGRTYVQWEVDGKGVRETSAGGGAYNTDSYTIGATGGDTPHAIAPPAIPTEHPEP